MGDVTLENFLQVHNLLPKSKQQKGFYFTCFDSKFYLEYIKLANFLRENNFYVEMSLERPKKFGKDLELAEKKGYTYVLIMGEDEFNENKIKVKNISTGEERFIFLENKSHALEELKILIGNI